MRPYLFSLLAGVLVGIIYSLVGIRSPAPPIVALVDILGILVGEQVASLTVYVFTKGADSTLWIGHDKPNMFEARPTGLRPSGENPRGASADETD